MKSGLSGRPSFAKWVAGMKDLNMLLVEHPESVAEQTEKRLKDLGYAVCATASSEGQAIARALETRPQVVLVGLAVEDGFDGIEVARQMRQLEIPVLLLTDGARVNPCSVRLRWNRLATCSGLSRNGNCAFPFHQLFTCIGEERGISRGRGVCRVFSTTWKPPLSPLTLTASSRS